MYPKSFDYYSPSSVEEALKLLQAHGDNAKILAGGMSLIPTMKLRLAQPGVVVDINGIRELEFIKESGPSLVIGALTRHHVLESHSLVRDKVPMLAEAASQIGDPQVRNMGTIGGSLAHSDPSADLGTALLALRAELKLKGGSGERRLPIDNFIVDTFATALRQDELIVEVSVKLPPRGSGGSYQKLERRAGDFGTVAVAAQLTLDAKGVCSYAGIGLAAVASKNIRAAEAEKAILGRRLTEENIELAAKAASMESQPMDDPLRGSADYKREMVAVYTRRALKMAAARARGEK